MPREGAVATRMTCARSKGHRGDAAGTPGQTVAAATVRTGAGDAGRAGDGGGRGRTVDGEGGWLGAGRGDGEASATAGGRGTGR